MLLLPSSWLSAFAARSFIPWPLLFAMHGGQMFSPSSFVTCWLYLSSAPFCEGFVISHDSSSKSLPLKSEPLSLSWHLSTAATSLAMFFPTVCSHLSELALLGTQPVSSSPMSASLAESQYVDEFCESSTPNSTDSSVASLVSWMGSQMFSPVSLVIA